MNESGLLDGYSIFDRSKKFVFKKKLEIFEDTANRMLLRLVYFNKTSAVMANEGWCSIGFPIESRFDLQQMQLISVQNLLTFS